MFFIHNIVHMGTYTYWSGNDLMKSKVILFSLLLKNLEKFKGFGAKIRP